MFLYHASRLWYFQLPLHIFIQFLHHFIRILQETGIQPHIIHPICRDVIPSPIKSHTVKAAPGNHLLLRNIHCTTSVRQTVNIRLQAMRGQFLSVKKIYLLLPNAKFLQRLHHATHIQQFQAAHPVPDRLLQIFCLPCNATHIILRLIIQVQTCKFIPTYSLANKVLFITHHNTGPVD